jgi:hypothetical protein
MFFYYDPKKYSGTKKTSNTQTVHKSKLEELLVHKAVYA